MPPLSTSPLMLDLGVYLPVPAETSTLRPVSASLDGVEAVEATHAGVKPAPPLKSRRNGFLTPPEFVTCAHALRTLAHIGRLKREGRELRRKRLAAGLSKGQAARLCGVSARQVYRWESGERAVPGWVWERIA